MAAIAGIAAGKAHSLACCANGDLYSWGKSWNGETGTGVDRYMFIRS